MKLNEFLDTQDFMLKKHFETKITGFLTLGTLTEKDNNFKAVYRFKYPNKVKIEIFLPDNKVYTEGFDGTRGWEMDTYVSGGPMEALRHGAEWPNSVKSVKDFMASGHQAEYQGIENIEDQNYHTLLLRQKDGFSRTYYFDIESFLHRRGRDNRPLHPGENTRNMEALFLDYKLFDGVYIATKEISKDNTTGEILLDINWTNVEINPDIAVVEFEKLKS